MRYLEIQLTGGARKLVLDTFLEFIPDEGKYASSLLCYKALKQKIIKDCMLKTDVTSLWKSIEAAATHLNLTSAIDALLVKWTFPRLDVNVSVQNTHLIKVPFSIHPDTNKICVPIQIDTIDNFVVESAPSLHSLASDTTSLQPYLTYFANFVYSM